MPRFICSREGMALAAWADFNKSRASWVVSQVVSWMRPSRLGGCQSQNGHNLPDLNLPPRGGHTLKEVIDINDKRK